MVNDRATTAIILPFTLPHVPWHQALSVPCWCGEHHDPWEASDLNRVTSNGSTREAGE